MNLIPDRVVVRVVQPSWSGVGAELERSWSGVGGELALRRCGLHVDDLIEVGVDLGVELGEKRSGCGEGNHGTQRGRGELGCLGGAPWFLPCFGQVRS